MLSALITYVGADPVIAEPLRVGIPGLRAEFAPVWAANDRGLLKKYGFESEIIAMQGGTQLAPGGYRRQHSHRRHGRRLPYRGGTWRGFGHDRHSYGQVSLFADCQAEHQESRGSKRNQVGDQPLWLVQRCRFACGAAKTGFESG